MSKRDRVNEREREPEHEKEGEREGEIEEESCDGEQASLLILMD